MFLNLFNQTLLLLVVSAITFSVHINGQEEGDLRYAEFGLQVAINSGPGNGNWHYVARSKFGFDEAILACRILSSSSLVSYFSNIYDVAELVEVNCGGNDATFDDCRLDRVIGDDYINVTCLKQSDVAGRITGQLEDNRVLIHVLEGTNFVWGHVCVDDMNVGFNEISADLFCINLGFDRAIAGDTISLVLQTEELTVVDFSNCAGINSFDQCSYSLKPGGMQNCRDSSVIAVKCEYTTREITSTNTTEINPTRSVTKSPESDPTESTITMAPHTTTPSSDIESFTAYTKIIYTVKTTANTISTATISSTNIPTIKILDILRNMWFIMGAIMVLLFVCCLFLTGLVCICLCVRRLRKTDCVVNTHYLAQTEYSNAFQIEMPPPNHYDNQANIFTNNVALNNEDTTHKVIFKTLRDKFGQRQFQIPKESDYNSLIYGFGNIVPNMEERLSNSNKVVDSWEDDTFSGYISPCPTRQCFADKKSSEFWIPHNTLVGIFDQMSKRLFREILPNELCCDKKLGEGNFGYVYSGTWKCPGVDTPPVPVAIKSIKSDENESNLGFMKEAATLGQFDHPNVLKLLGVVTLFTPHMMVTELLFVGLKQFLEDTANSGTVNFNIFAPLFLNFSLDISNGMEHLASKLYVHRDLAARNILLSHNLCCKIGDFGLARRARVEDEYYVSSGGLIPFKWTSPEGICYHKYSEKSDVWSYGVTLYEIWSVGQDPWWNLLPQEVIDKITIGSVMAPPSGCPRAIYKLMVDCWHPNKMDRPCFSEIADLLDDDSNQILVRGNTRMERREMGKPPSELRSIMFLDLQNKYQVKKTNPLTLPQERRI